MELLQFLKANKIRLIVKRSIENKQLYSCELLNGYLKKDFYFINVYGIGNNENEAINDLIKIISEKVLIFNIDNYNKKKIIKVPNIEKYE